MSGRSGLACAAVLIVLAAVATATVLTFATKEPAPASPATRADVRPVERNQGAPPGVAVPRAAGKTASIARGPEAKPASLEEPEPPDEGTSLAILRELMVSEPEEAIERAERDDARFESSAHRAERAWIRVRALVNLGRFEAARESALLLKQSHAGTPWALDAERHLLVHPLDVPSREAELEGSH